QVNLDAGGVFNGPVTDAYYGMFEDADGALQIFGDPSKATGIYFTGDGDPVEAYLNEDAVEVDSYSGTFTEIDIRLIDGNNLVLGNAALDVPFAAYGGAGSDIIVTGASSDTIIS